MNNKIYIYKEKTNKRNYRICILRHDNTMFHVASFDNIEQLNFFCQTLGVKYEVNEILHEGTEHEIQVCFTDKIIRDGFYFWKIEDLPEGIKPIKALSNGSIVTCYYKTDKEAVIYRPNPNAKEVYDPLETAEHIAHKKIYGTY